MSDFSYGSTKKKEAVIIDLDGTLADIEHRRHFMSQKPKDWKSFYAAIPDDFPNAWCLRLMHHLSSTALSAGSRALEIIIMSGRPLDYYNETVDWLAKHRVPYDRLIMRNTGDFRKDSIVKQELYEKHVKEKYRVLFCVDDRKQVVDMWREIGLVCLQCEEGNF